VRASIRERDRTNVALAPAQSELVLRSGVETGGTFNAGGTQGSWVEFNFEYGNRYVTAHVSLDTWNPARGSSFTWLGSQNFVDSAYLMLRPPPFGKLKLGWTVGAFGVTYGPLGENGGGFYQNPVGRIQGTGETLAAEYRLTDTWLLTLQHGFHSAGDKAPEAPHRNEVPGAPDPWAQTPVNLGDSYDPSAWIHHLHLGFVKSGDITITTELHYLHNFSLDDRGLLRAAEPPTSGSSSNYDEDPRRETPAQVGENEGIDESDRRDDGVYTAYGANVGLRGNWFRAGAGIVYGRAKNAYALHGLAISYVGDGETFSNDWIGPRSLDEKNNWAGSMWSVAAETELGWGSFWRRPEPFWGEGTDLRTTLGFQFGRISSHDPERDGWSMYRVGVNVLASLLPWLGAETRLDQVNPNTDRPEQIYYAWMARIILRTFWTSHEQVALQYNKWIYGSEKPVNFRAPPVEDLDDDVLSLGFSMWW
jgi:hypothetical protein